MPDSLLQIYRKTRDSIDRVVFWKKNRITNTGSGIFYGFIGVNRIEECDSCNGMIDNKAEYNRKHFISFRGFELKNNATFRIDKNNYIIDNFVAENESDIGAT